MSTGETRTNARYLITSATRRLAAVVNDTPALEARLLLAHALKVDPNFLGADLERKCTESEAFKYETLLKRRLKYEPISHLVGRREFWSLDFRVNKAVLDPRPDSETLITTALGYYSGQYDMLKVLDIGTGTGCLLLSFLSERPRSHGFGIDISMGAIDVARKNSEILCLSDRTQFLLSNWLSAITGCFDLIFCNPPYIPTAEIGGLPKEVRNFDPHLALDGGDDGLEAYRIIFSQLANVLSKNGVAVFEVGAGKTEIIRKLAAENGIRILKQKKDLAGHMRCLVVCLQR